MRRALRESSARRVGGTVFQAEGTAGAKGHPGGAGVLGAEVAVGE